MEYMKKIDPDTMDPIALFRRETRKGGLYIELYKVGQGWVDHPGLAGWASAIGGADDFLRVDAAEAEAIIAGWGRPQKKGGSTRPGTRTDKGSGTSGNWGHTGYPGRGGSSGGSAFARIGAKPGMSRADVIARRTQAGGGMKVTPSAEAKMARKLANLKVEVVRSFLRGESRRAELVKWEGLIELGQSHYGLTEAQAKQAVYGALDVAEAIQEAETGTSHSIVIETMGPTWEEWDRAGPISKEADLRIQITAERDYYELGFETGHLMSPDGKTVVLRKSGTTDTLMFEDDEMAAFNGNILTHNHPLGSGFSPSDLMTSVANNALGVRAFGVVKWGDNEGKAFLHTAQPDSGVRRMGVGNLATFIDGVDRDVAKRFSSQIHQGALSTANANANHWHEVFTEVDAKLRRENIGTINYQRRPINLPALLQAQAPADTQPTAAQLPLWDTIP